MVIIPQKIFPFKNKRIYLADSPCDVEGCDVVFFTHCRTNMEFEGFTKILQYTTITNLTPDLDTIWGSIKRQCRYEIRKAEQLNIRIHINQYHNDFHKIQLQLHKMNGWYSPLRNYLNFNIPDAKTIRDHALLLTAEHEGQIIVGNVYLADTNYMLLWLSAGKRMEYDFDKEKTRLISRANRLLHWEAIKWAKEKHIREIDWGGINPPELVQNDETMLKVNMFKLSFGRKPVIRSHYKKVYSKIYQCGQKIYALRKPT